MCGFLGVCKEPLPLRNQYLLAEAPGTQMITWGSTDDAVYVQGKCVSKKLPPPDNSSTEIIQGAGGGLEDRTRLIAATEAHDSQPRRLRIGQPRPSHRPTPRRHRRSDR